MRRTNFTIRPAAPADAAAWLKLRSSLWPQSPPAEHRAEIARYFAGPNPHIGQVLFAEDSMGGVIGFLELALRAYAPGCTGEQVAFVEGWFVAPESRRLGGGRALITAALDWARAQGCTDLASDTPLANAEAIAAHRQVGFAETEKVVYFRMPVGG